MIGNEDRHGACSAVEASASVKEKILKTKTMLCGFIAIWFFAASPMRRSLSEKET